MEKDRLKTFNVELAADLQKMTDDELWDFIQSNEERVKEFWETHKRFHTGTLFAYKGGQERYRKHFLSQIEDCRVGEVYNLIRDFCFGDEEIPIEYWARSGFLDSPDSCAVKTSEEIMPNLDDVDEEEEMYISKIYFHLLENNHVLNIIKSLNNNVYKLSENTFDDIAKIEAIRDYCEKNPNYQIMYLYDVCYW